MRYSLSLSDAKATLSKVVRDVRSSGASVLITVDGEPAARVEPVTRAARALTPRATRGARSPACSCFRVKRNWALTKRAPLSPSGCTADRSENP